ncbi:MAG: glycosyltransferase family 39 protein, partial [Lactobacillaceae bacterium]|nr:glycosyltransferase family 39 protein [Lactobacillaceae bacterium]
IKFKNITLRIFRKINQYKKYVVGLMVIFQLLIIISTTLMLRSDAAAVFRGAVEIDSVKQISQYLSLNINNIFLFLYEKFFYIIFKSNAVWILQIINILIVDIAIWISYKIGQRFFDKKIADIIFWLFTLSLGFTPQFVTMYTDPMTLPITAGAIYLIFLIFKKDSTLPSNMPLILLGFLVALGYIIRPTIVIIYIAFFIVMILKTILVKKDLIKNFKIISITFVTLVVSILGFKTMIDHQNIVPIAKNQNATIYWFLDLGLTSNGTDQMDLRAGLDAESKKLGLPITDKKVAIADIKRRIKEYTPASFARHLKIKTNGLIYDGTFGWNYTENTITTYYNPLKDKLENNYFLSKFRNLFIYTEKNHYYIFAVWLQIIYITIIVGYLIFLFRNDFNDKINIINLAFFGGLLFLTIFEGGKPRYMMQFMPQAILLASIGLSKLKGANLNKK